MKPALLSGMALTLIAGCASAPDGADITTITGHSDYVWKEMPWGVIIAETDADVAVAIGEYDAAKRALSEHFDLLDQRGAVIVNSVASEIDQIERTFDLDWVLPWDFGLSEMPTQDMLPTPNQDPDAARNAAIKQQIVDQLSAGGSEPDPEMVEKLYQQATKQLAEQSPTGRAENFKPLRHELGHMLFVHGVWAIETEVQQYASGAPDWLDEVAAVLAEDPVLTQRRRDQVKALVVDDEMMSFETWFNMQHPVYETAMELIAQKIERDGDGFASGAFVLTAEDFEAAGVEVDAKAADFYSISRGFIDYLEAKSNDARTLQIITQDLKDGVAMEEILRTRGERLGLPTSFEDFDKDFADWMIGQS